MKELQGNLVSKNKQYAIVASRFNEFITNKLIEGAKDCLVRHGVNDNEITLCRVPGAFEIPPVARKLVDSGKYDSVICLGAIIRGETPHFDYVASESAKGIANISMNSSIPVVYGVITADTLEQAIDRAGTKAGNKGADAAQTAIEMVNLMMEIGE